MYKKEYNFSPHVPTDMRITHFLMVQYLSRVCTHILGRLEIGPACLAGGTQLPLDCQGQLIIHSSKVTFNSNCGGGCQHDVQNAPHFDDCWVNMTHDGMVRVHPKTSWVHLKTPR